MRGAVVAAARRLGRGVDLTAFEAAVAGLDLTAASRLTRDGCPVEFAFSSSDAHFRTTVDPLLGVADCHHRLRRLGTMAGAADAEWLTGCERAQHGGALRWGAWLGLRSLDAGLGAKLYAEIPRGAVLDAPRAPAGGRLTMTGRDLSNGIEEYYYALPKVSETQLMLVANAAGVARGDALLDMLQQCWSLPITTALAWQTLGVSLRCRGGVPVPGLAVHFNAAALPDGNAYVRRAMLGQVSPGYRALWGDDTADSSDHGLVSVAASPDATEIRCGISASAVVAACRVAA